jgi:hypothetical protein
LLTKEGEKQANAIEKPKLGPAVCREVVGKLGGFDVFLFMSS